jgi:rhodanese-related sulfurtransferase
MQQPRRPFTAIGQLPRSVVLALMLAAVLFGGGFAAGQESQSVLHPDRHLLERQAEAVDGGVGVVTPEQVLAVGADTYLLVDVRGRDAFDFVHAVGAIAIPEAEVDQLAATLPHDRTLVLYCTCPDEKTSLRAARTLAGVYGVTNVVALKGGLLAYRAAGGELSSEATDSAIEHQGCGCTVNAPAFKLWVMNNEAQAEPAKQDEGS